MKKHLTIEGQKKILDELEHLTGVKRAEQAEELKYATIYKRKNNGTIEIGSTVTIKIDEELEEYKTVGLNEGDAMENKIPYESALAQALLGKGVNKNITVESEIGNYDCLIINISSFYFFAKNLLNKKEITKYDYFIAFLAFVNLLFRRAALFL